MMQRHEAWHLLLESLSVTGSLVTHMQCDFCVFCIFIYLYVLCYQLGHHYSLVGCQSVTGFIRLNMQETVSEYLLSQCYIYQTHIAFIAFNVVYWQYLDQDNACSVFIYCLKVLVLTFLYFLSSVSI